MVESRKKGARSKGPRVRQGHYMKNCFFGVIMGV